MSTALEIDIAGQKVPLTEPSRKWRRILRAPVGVGMNRELWQMACLGVCWGGPNRPAGDANPRDVMRYGEAVLDDLIARGVSDEQLDTAGQTAMVLIFGEPGDLTPDPDPAEVGETADFSAPPGDGSATS